MNRKIRHYFIATAENAYHPHLLRWWALGIIGFGLLAVQLLFNLTAAQPSVLGFATNIDEQTIVKITNTQRVQAGAEPLALSRQLTAAARQKAQHMFDNNYWAHVAPDGTQPWDFLRNQNYPYMYAGENLAKNFATSGGVVDGWMKSDGHRHNLLNADYTEVGIAAVNGQLNGEETTLVVAMYGRPSQFPVVATDSHQSKLQPQITVGSSVLGLNASTVTWVQRATLPIVGFIALLYVGQHVVVRRKNLRWDHAAHPRPLLQAGVMVGLMVAIVFSGQGVVL